MFKSIKWRLPLSYAGIALLATLVLGGIDALDLARPLLGARESIP